jgi:SET domain-containing protein
VFAIASNFNHACKSRRNTKYDWDERQQLMTFTAIRDVAKGEEMLISYCDYRWLLKATYGFVCHCGGCEHQAAEMGV